MESPGRGAEARDLLVHRFALSSGLVTAVEVDELPRLASGKPDLARLRDLARAQEPATGHAQSCRHAGSAPGAVAALYAEVLDVDQVRPDDTFVSLGGDSLSYIEITHELERTHGELPEGWHVMSVGELEARVAVDPELSRASRADATVVLRAVAMVAIIATHLKMVSLEGGGHLLLGVAGYNTARFSLDGTGPGWLGQNLWRVARIALPIIAYLAVLAVVVGGIDVSTVLLGSTYVGEGTWRFRFWFVEAVVVILLVVVLVLAVPAVRKVERHSPLGFALGVVFLTVAVRDLDLGQAEFTELQPHAVAWLFALGWLIHRADTPWRRVLASVVAAITVWGAFADPSRELAILGGVLLLTWWRAIPVPRALRAPLNRVAAASLAIYVVQWHVVDQLGPRLPGWIVTVVAIVGGCVAHAVSGATTRAIRRRWPVARRPAAVRPRAGGAPRPRPTAHLASSMKET